MKNKNLIIIGLFFSIMSCRYNKLQNVNSPLATVIKLHSAETLVDFEEAKRYIDINSVYDDESLIGDTLSAEQRWKETVSFMANVTDKKFTTQFKYFDYDIVESIADDKAEVQFKPKREKNMGIYYELRFKNGNWIIVKIYYKK